MLRADARTTCTFCDRCKGRESLTARRSMSTTCEASRFWPPSFSTHLWRGGPAFRSLHVQGRFCVGRHRTAYRARSPRLRALLPA